MRIADIREQTISLADPMGNAAISYAEMTASIVAIETDAVRDGRPVVGYGFSSIGRYGHGGLMRERFMPRLLAVESLEGEDGGFDPFLGWEAMMSNEKPGGDGERSGAVGVLDMALWDAAAKIAGVPLWKLLADRFNGGEALDRVPVYASGGHYHDGDALSALTDEVQGIVDRGYVIVKIKCGRDGLADDCRRIEAALKALGNSGERLAVDVNGAYGTPEEAFAMADALGGYGLAWIEEPGHPHDFDLLAELTDEFDLTLGTGENLFSGSELRNLLLYGGLRPEQDLIQIDPALAYGVPEYVGMVQLMESGDWSRAQCVPHAGHLYALHLVAGLQLGAHEAAPDAMSIYGGFANDVDWDDGQLTLPQAPGIGFERKENLFAVLETLNG